MRCRISTRDSPWRKKLRTRKTYHRRKKTLFWTTPSTTPSTEHTLATSARRRREQYENERVTITNLGAESKDEVLVYDSLYPSVSTCVHKQIAALLHTSSREITVKIMDMQIQAGTCDCGLFAIATATALLSGVQPGACTFKQREMRKHVYDGFKQGKILLVEEEACKQEGEIYRKNISVLPVQDTRSSR